jgi:hypothetical protein
MQVDTGKDSSCSMVEVYSLYSGRSSASTATKSTRASPSVPAEQQASNITNMQARHGQSLMVDSVIYENGAQHMAHWQLSPKAPSTAVPYAGAAAQFSCPTA